MFFDLARPTASLLVTANLRRRIHLNPVREGLVGKPQQWPGSSYNNFTLDKAIVAGCPIEINDVRLPKGYAADEKSPRSGIH